MLISGASSEFLKLTQEQIEEKYLVSWKNGFLVDCSQVNLPICWSPFEQAAKQLTEHVEKKSIRETVLKLNGDHDIPKEKRQQLVLHKILTFLTSGYIWQDGEEDVPKELPWCLSKPLTRVSDALGVQPILSYPSMILGNWKMKNVDKPFEFGNVNAMYWTPGGDGAEWFIVTHVIIEQRFAPALDAIVEAMKHSSPGSEDNAKLVEALRNIPKVMSEMMYTFTKINDGVQPEHFYDELRIFYSGWGNGRNPLPDGLIYKGVYGDKPKTMKGGSAAQSTTLQLLDAALGIKHEGDQKNFLDEVRDYMMKEHRDFCDVVEENSNIRKYVDQCENDDVQLAYNKCIDAIRNFRNLHMKKVDQYIKRPSQRNDRRQAVEGLKDTGTGSTPYLEFLKRVNEDTKNCTLTKK
ncbi:myoglobin-like [Ylistrum balloti]|uniref:myoglobin-like n=1 Tax=Ylistrum balloti TaxID=509963 RepID=UPI00290588E5|nr:myoglobin-like [Ylistrum balloti]